jgi:hypothetical protein
MNCFHFLCILYTVYESRLQKLQSTYTSNQGRLPISQIQKHLRVGSFCLQAKIAAIQKLLLGSEHLLKREGTIVCRKEGTIESPL